MILYKIRQVKFNLH